jgi:hypothetical protein
MFHFFEEGLTSTWMSMKLFLRQRERDTSSVSLWMLEIHYFEVLTDNHETVICPQRHSFGPNPLPVQPTCPLWSNLDPTAVRIDTTNQNLELPGAASAAHLFNNTKKKRRYKQRNGGPTLPMSQTILMKLLRLRGGGLLRQLIQRWWCFCWSSATCRLYW